VSSAGSTAKRRRLRAGVERVYAKDIALRTLREHRVNRGAGMRHSTELPPFTREPPPAVQPSAGPIRFSLGETPAGERDALYREFFGRSVMRYDVDPSPDVPFDIDVKLQTLPGLLMVTGKMHGSNNRRTQEWIADGLDDFAMAVNLGGKYVICQGDQEIVLDNGEATLFSLGKLCNLMHWPPGGLLAMRFPRSQIAPRIAHADELCMRRIRAGTQALSLLTSYVNIAQDSQTVASRELQQVFVSHAYDLIALAVGATGDAAQEAEDGGLRAARLHTIKQDIARNLDQANLSVTVVASRHGCTPRFVQRSFEREGTTFTEYVLAQRLMRAHRMLTDPRRADEKISTVAFDSGFSDVSYFNRVFRRRYGAAPSDIRAQAHGKRPAASAKA
jgi:AraC-like DNA-binding protein